MAVGVTPTSAQPTQTRMPTLRTRHFPDLPITDPDTGVVTQAGTV